MTTTTPGGDGPPPSEADVLASFGYEQELDRAMGRFSSFAVSFSGMSITAAIFLTISFVFTHSGSAGIWAWPISSVGVLLVGLVFADLVGRIPVAGYAYQWSSRLTNARFGWFVAVCGLIGFARRMRGHDLRRHALLHVGVRNQRHGERADPERGGAGDHRHADQRVRHPARVAAQQHRGHHRDHRRRRSRASRSSSTRSSSIPTTSGSCSTSSRARAGATSARSSSRSCSARSPTPRGSSRRTWPRRRRTRRTSRRRPC